MPSSVKGLSWGGGSRSESQDTYPMSMHARSWSRIREVEGGVDKREDLSTEQNFHPLGLASLKNIKAEAS